MAVPSYYTRGETVAYYAVRVFVGLVLLFLISPIIAVMPLSFNSESFFTYPMPGYSLKWYDDFFFNPRWTGAVRMSFVVALATTVLATALGTLAALGLSRANFPLKATVMAILISPMIVPVIISAVGMFKFYAYAGNLLTETLGFGGSPSWLPINVVLAHTALATPFVVITVTATLSSFDKTLVRAGASCGAAPHTVFFKVMMPLILPGMISGALFAFVTSFDEVVVVLFLASPEQRTLPLQMFSGIREMISPTITAAATVLVLISTALLITVEMLRRRSERLRGIRS